MIYTDNTKKAIKLCFEAHKGQIDKGGMPYVFHPFHVAEQMPTEEAVIVALLHDVVEDSGITIKDLRIIGFEENVVSAISLLTHKRDVPYMDYIATIAENPLARMVKIADLAHNLDRSRLDCINSQTEQRLEKYQKALDILLNKEI